MSVIFRPVLTVAGAGRPLVPLLYCGLELNECQRNYADKYCGCTRENRPSGVL